MKPKKKIKNSLNNHIVLQLYDEHKKERDKLIKEYDKLINNIGGKEKMEKNILEKRNFIWFPKYNIQTSNVLENTWFTIKESKKQKIKFDKQDYITDELNDIKYKSKQILLKLTNEQKDKINK